MQADSAFKAFDAATSSAGDGAVTDELEADPCNTFKADQVLGRKSEMFDQNGIVTILCRYDLLRSGLSHSHGIAAGTNVRASGLPMASAYRLQATSQKCCTYGVACPTALPVPCKYLM